MLLQQFVDSLKFLFVNGAEDESSPYHNEALKLMSKSVRPQATVAENAAQRKSVLQSLHFAGKPKRCISLTIPT